MNELNKFKKAMLQGYADAVAVLFRFDVVDADPPYLDAGEERYVIGPSGALALAAEPKEDW